MAIKSGTETKNADFLKNEKTTTTMVTENAVTDVTTMTAKDGTVMTMTAEDGTVTTGEIVMAMTDGDVTMTTGDDATMTTAGDGPTTTTGDDAMMTTEGGATTTTAENATTVTGDDATTTSVNAAEKRSKAAEESLLNGQSRGPEAELRLIGEQKRGKINFSSFLKRCLHS